MEAVVSLLKGSFLELVSQTSGLVAAVFSVLAFIVARQAIQFSKASDLSARRDRARERVAAAEASFISLRSACDETLRLWATHHRKHYAPLFDSTRQPNDAAHITDIKAQGQQLLSELKAEKIDALCGPALDKHIQRAYSVALAIERLQLELRRPEPIFF